MAFAACCERSMKVLQRFQKRSICIQASRFFIFALVYFRFRFVLFRAIKCSLSKETSAIEIDRVFPVAGRGKTYVSFMKSSGQLLATNGRLLLLIVFTDVSWTVCVELYAGIMLVQLRQNIAENSRMLRFEFPT